MSLANNPLSRKHYNFSATGSRIVARFTPAALSLVNISLLILNSSIPSLSSLSGKLKDDDDDDDDDEYESSVLFSCAEMSCHGC